MYAAMARGLAAARIALPLCVRMAGTKKRAAASVCDAAKKACVEPVNNAESQSAPTECATTAEKCSAAAGRTPTHGRPPYPKRKVALMLGYRGSAYQGMQLNPGAHTVEAVLFRALVAAGLVSEENAVDPKKVAWMRACRTDKGVHAAGQVVSLKMLVKLASAESQPALNGGDVLGPEQQREEDEALGRAVDEINAHLPEDVRVFAVRRVNNGFHAKDHCDSRHYEYLLPTYALAPADPGPYVHPVPRPFSDRAAKSTSTAGSQSSAADGQVDAEAAVNCVPQDSGSADDAAAEPILDLAGGAKKGQTDSDDSETSGGDEDEGPYPYAFSVSDAERAAAHAYRVCPARLAAARALMKRFEGWHAFHNFTIGKSPRDPSARRRILSAEISDPFVVGGIEWVAVRLHGQSFMLHQIRKMVALVAMCVRLGCGPGLLDAALDAASGLRLNVPKAPSLGLFLDYAVFESHARRQFGGAARPAVAFEDGGCVAEARRALKARLIYPEIHAEEARAGRFLGWLRCNDAHASEFAYFGRYVSSEQSGQ